MYLNNIYQKTWTNTYMYLAILTHAKTFIDIYSSLINYNLVV